MHPSLPIQRPLAQLHLRRRTAVFSIHGDSSTFAVEPLAEVGGVYPPRSVVAHLRSPDGL